MMSNKIDEIYAATETENKGLNDYLQTLTDIVVPKDMKWEYAVEPGSNCNRCWQVVGVDRTRANNIASQIFSSAMPAYTSVLLSKGNEIFRKVLYDGDFNYASFISGLLGSNKFISDVQIAVPLTYHLTKALEYAD